MNMDRRTALSLLAAGVSSQRLARAQQHLHELVKAPQNYSLQFFSEAENAIVDRVAEMILPADSRSGGAHEARVNYYIDLVVANSARPEQSKWRERLAAFRSMAVQQFGGEFGALDQNQQKALLDALAAKERQPVEPAEMFFVEMKKVTISAYYTSQIGLLKELGYKGNQALSEFPGCSAPIQPV
jgi:gluconate 2-dehydrogenase gamma chain